MGMIKIYEVEFVQYTNASRNTVSKSDGEYLALMTPFLITESEVEVMQEWGEGIRNLRFVGYLEE